MEKEKPQCFDFDTGQRDTAGQPVMGRQCFCGTTACTHGKTFKTSFVNRPEYLGVQKDLDCDCEYETVLKDGNICRKCQDRFYKNVLKTRLI